MAEYDDLPWGMHGPSPILGPDGQPMPRAAQLREPVAFPQLVGARTMWDQSTASGLDPGKLAVTLQQCIRGDTRAYLTLAEEMEERDAHYAAVLGVRRRALAGVKPSIDAASESKTDAKIADAVRDLIEEPEFTELVEAMQDANGKGFSVCEIAWTERDGLWRPADYIWRDPKYFTFDHVSRSTLRLAEIGTIDGLDLPPARFIQHAPALKTGIPIRAGLARVAAWGFLFKSFALKDWAAFLDVFGMPLRVGKYHPNATADEKRALLRSVLSIASDAAAIIPEGMAIEFIEAAKGSGGNAPFERMARYIDEQLSKIVLGQTMATDAGASLAQAKIHNEVRLDIVEWDGRQTAKTLNRDLIAWFVALNFGANAPCPRIEFNAPKPEDVTALAGALEKLVPLGLKVEQDEVREKLGMRTPKSDAELLAAPKPPSPAPADPAAAAPPSPLPPDQKAALNRRLAAGCPCGCGGRTAFNAEGAPGDDELAEIEAAAMGDWERQGQALAAPLVAAVMNAASYEEAMAALDRAQPDVEALTRGLAIAAMKARGLGRDRDV